MFSSATKILWCCNRHHQSNVSKRINVTLPDAVYEELEWWAEAQGRPTANLANFLIESALRQARERGEIPPKPKTPASGTSAKGTGGKGRGKKGVQDD